MGGYYSYLEPSISDKIFAPNPPERFALKRALFKLEWLNYPYRSAEKLDMVKRKSGPIGSFIAGLVFTLVGAGLFYLKAWPDYKQAKDSVNWPSTIAIMERIKVVEKRSRKKKTQYGIDSMYTYTVDGVQYKSDQIYVGSANYYTSSSSEMYALKNKYPVGKGIKVYYSSSNHAESLLETGLTRMNYILLACSVLFALVGILIFAQSALKLAILGAKISIFLSSLFNKERDDTEAKLTQVSYGVPQRFKTLFSSGLMI